MDAKEKKRLKDLLPADPTSVCNNVQLRLVEGGKCMTNLTPCKKKNIINVFNPKIGKER